MNWKMTENLIVNACITGMVPTKSKNPWTPVSVQEIIHETRKVYQLGASIVHIHARGSDESPVWEPSYYQEIVSGIRETTPEIIVCVTTSGRLWSDPEKRCAALLLEGSAKPDMASLTLGSFNFPDNVSHNPPRTIHYLLDIMNEQGIVPEIEIFDLGMVDYLGHLMDMGKVEPPVYANIILGNRGTAKANHANLEYLVSRLPAQTVWAGAGIGKAQFNVHKMALEMNGHIRIGIEDNLYMDHQTKDPASNSDLILRSLNLAKEMGRMSMSASNVRKILHISK